MSYEVTALADEHPRGILLYSTHCVYISSFSNFSYFFPQVSRQEEKDPTHTLLTNHLIQKSII